VKLRKKNNTEEIKKRRWMSVGEARNKKKLPPLWPLYGVSLWEKGGPGRDEAGGASPLCGYFSSEQNPQEVESGGLALLSKVSKLGKEIRGERRLVASII